MHLSRCDKFNVQAWIKSFIVLFCASFLLSDSNSSNTQILILIAHQSIIPLSICALLNYALITANRSMSYVLFFTITITSVLGLSKTLTGTHSESSLMVLFGVSFYTATLAYLCKSKQITFTSGFISSNPLLLVTGPIATSFKTLSYKSVRSRVKYYFPFVTIGVFLHQIIATPITNTQFLINKTDALSTIIYSLIFEIFVYTNFCGLSLIIYGIFGMLGIKVPLNFKQPFSSRNLIEFWRGWHISISVVLKELFYSPIKKVFGTSAAILGVFLSSALWHGVSINFLLWGLFHSLCFLLSIFLLKYNIKYIPTLVAIIAIPFARLLSSDDNIKRLASKLFFNYTDTSILFRLWGLGNLTKLALLLGAIFIASEWIFKNHKTFRKRNYKFYRLPYVQISLLAMIFLCIHNQGISYAVYGQR